MLKSLKKIISLAILFILALSLFPAAALASTGTVNVTYDNRISNVVDNTNRYVENSIARATNLAATAVSNEQNVTGTINGIISGSTQQQQTVALLNVVDQSAQRLNQTVDSICDRLVQGTDRKAAQTVEIAAKDGVQITPYYEEVTIYDQTILVDPLMFH